MTNPILRKTAAHHEEKDEANKGAVSLRTAICNGFNRAFVETKRFLLRCTNNSDHKVLVDEANRSRNPFPDSHFSQPSPQVSANPKPSANQARRNADRIAEAFGARHPNQFERENFMTQYSEARDIRPSPLRIRRHLSMRNLNYRERQSRDESNLPPRIQNQRTNPRILRRRSLDAASSDRFVRRNTVYRLVSHNGFIAPVPVIEDDNVSLNSVRIVTGIWGHRRRRRRKYMTNGRLDWGKYEEDRKKYPSRLVKRKHETTFESLMQEPEHKLPKIAQYWVVKKAGTDGENNAERQDERLRLDWDQYELERSLWPERCVKRKRRMELASLLEEPVRKLRRIGK